MAYTDIDKPSDYFNTKLYTGDGTTSHAITGVGFQPDWVWIKRRNSGNPHFLNDSVRGATKDLRSDNTDAETTNNVFGILKSFDSDGFTVSVGSTNGARANTSGGTFTSWNWLGANASSSNTDGSITSSVSANTTSGFSIVSYTGTGANATVGHGLGAVPKMIIVKSRSHAKDWTVYHSALGNTKWIELNSTGAEQSSSNRWNNTSPTSSVFTVATDSSVNASGYTYIAYCFADTGNKFFKAGSYTGNGNADGTFVYTGFKPAWVMVKKSNSTGKWVIWDNKRNDDAPAGGNYIDRLLYANASDAEVDTGGSLQIDFLSGGYKLRGTGTDCNASGSTYIYMAFAENPFVTSTGISTTAR